MGHAARPDVHLRGRGATPTPEAYSMVVHTRDGRTEQVATWRVAAGQDHAADGGHLDSRSDITSVEMRTADGEPRLSSPADASDALVHQHRRSPDDRQHLGRGSEEHPAARSTSRARRRARCPSWRSRTPRAWRPRSPTARNGGSQCRQRSSRPAITRLAATLSRNIGPTTVSLRNTSYHSQRCTAPDTSTATAVSMRSFMTLLPSVGWVGRTIGLTGEDCARTPRGSGPVRPPPA